MPNGVRLQNRFSALPFGRSRRRGLEGRAVRGRDQEAMLWKLWKSVRPGVGGSLRAGRRPLPSAPTISVSVAWSRGRLAYQMCPWRSPMGVWHFQEPRQVARGPEAKRKESSLDRASRSDRHAGPQWCDMIRYRWVFFFS